VPGADAAPAARVIEVNAQSAERSPPDRFAARLETEVLPTRSVARGGSAASRQLSGWRVGRGRRGRL
jgi:hypothetical protein